jgi:hypothetical protein
MCGVSSLWRLDKEVGGALIPDSMQRVSKCKLVVFCGAAARRRGGQNITLSIQKVFDCKGYKPFSAYRRSLKPVLAVFSPVQVRAPDLTHTPRDIPLRKRVTHIWHVIC